MPFFRKKRTGEAEQLKTNGVIEDIKLKSHGATFENPPLSNFVSPPDLTAETLAKSQKRIFITLNNVLSWAKEYFIAFLRSDGAEELFIFWEKIEQFKNVAEKKSSAFLEGNQSKLRDQDEIFRTKFQIEKAHLNIDLTVLESEDGNMDAFQWLIKAQSLMRQSLEEEYLPRYLESKFHIKCQVDFFTNSNSVSLYDILKNQNAMFYFMEFVDQEDKRPVLEFWLGATNFYEQFLFLNSDEESKIDLKLARGDAMVLYEKYISLQAPQPLGFRDEIRSEVERLICSNDEIAHCFDRACAEAFAFLHVNCLDVFLKSSLFLAFLSDLINSLSLPSKNHKRSESTSTCSSSSNSLPSPNAQAVPSSLRERKMNKLSMGRVNSLGKFESDADLEFLKQESGLTKTMKKFVNYDEKEKAKEELAWQVAAMIVNEVTSITMGTGDTNATL